MVIKLINMPFGHLSMPSLALTQLKAVLEATFGNAMDVEILYLNMDISLAEGMRALYDHALSPRGLMTGIGEWLFRQVAFPEAPDNAEAFLERYYSDAGEEGKAVRSYVNGPRGRLIEVLDDLVTRYRLDQADIIGFTSLFAQTVPSTALAQRIKQANPAVVTLLGGAACEGEIGQELARQLKAVDYVFTGPALSALPELVRLITQEEGDTACQILGVCSRETATALMPTAAPDQSWKQLPPPDYTDFLRAFDRSFPEGGLTPALLFQTSAGCWWGDRSKCSFCGLHAEACRFHTLAPDRAIEQLRALLPQGRANPFFMAVDSIMPSGYPHDVFTKVAMPPDGCIQYEVRPTLDAEEIRILSEAGVRLLQPGIEALASSTLKLMKKGMTAFQNIRFLKHCSIHPITLRWNLLLFSPDESEETYERYLRQVPLLSHLHPPEGAFPVNFVKNSRYLADPDAFGLDLEPHDFYGLTYPAEPGALVKLANVFIDRRADAARQDAWLESLNEAVKQWDARYYGSDGQPQARLIMFKDGDRSGIYDSRDGNETRYWINQETRDSLIHLDEPRRESEIGQAFSNAEQTLTELRDRQLLFEENGRMLSLVLPDVQLSQA